jgi:hypothetical protein
MINDGLKITGRLIIEKNGEVVQEVDNLVVTSGKQWVAKRMADQDTVMTHMAIGTNNTAAAVANTGLGAELERNALTVSGGTVSGATISYASTFPANDGTGAITEAGIFDTLGDTVDDVTITAAGSGYGSAPGVTFAAAPAGGTTATGTAVLGTGADSDKVVSISITNVGAGYTSAPIITITGSATATCTMKGGGDMLARTVFGVVNKGASDSMTITWTVTIS